MKFKPEISIDDLATPAKSGLNVTAIKEMEEGKKISVSQLS